MKGRTLRVGLEKWPQTDSHLFFVSTKKLNKLFELDEYDLVFNICNLKESVGVVDQHVIFGLL